MAKDMFNTLYIKFLAKKLESPKTAVRQRAVEKLWQMRDPRAFDLLVSALTDDDPSVRYFASIGLGELGDSRAIQPLMKAFDREPDAWNRVWAAAQLAILGEASILPQMFADIRIVDEQGMEDWDNHPLILAGISRIGEEAIPAIVDAFDDANDTVRWLAVMGLGEIRSGKALEILEQVASNDRDEFIRKEALYALENE